MEKQEVFEKHSKLINDAIPLLKERGERNKEISRRPESQSQEDVLFNIFRNNSLEVYTQYLEFAAKEVLDPDNVTSVFRLPVLRTLMDIYARFLFIHDDAFDKNTRFLKLLSYQLLTFHKNGDQNDFNKILALNKAHLDVIRPDYPKTWAAFDYDWLRDKRLLMPSWLEALSAAKMTKFSPQTSKIFGAQKEYDIYSYLSELFHGNPFLKHGSGRERYWLTALSISLTAYFLELVDNQLFRDDKKRDRRDWLKKVNEAKIDLLKYWQEERAISP